MTDSAIPLSDANLEKLPQTMNPPLYDRSSLDGGILHLGVGGFHRGHQAVYTDELLRMGKGKWSIFGAGIRPDDIAMRDALVPQNGLYTVVAREGKREEVRIVGSLTDYLYSPTDNSTVMEQMASAKTKIVSLTVTEKGYHTTGLDRRLDMEDPEIRRDLDNPDFPRTMPGVVVGALRRRFRMNAEPFTIMSCDNIPENGNVIKSILEAYTREVDPELSRWIRDEVLCPNTMVDRITPVTTDDNRKFLETKYGVTDRWPVFCELFSQWIIEDRFTQGRPNWNEAGAEFVDDVKPYELMKIRLLNGTHSALSYLALLLGHEEVPAAMEDPEILAFVRSYMKEVEESLEPIPGLDYAEYRDSLVRRFANPNVADRTERLAQDGSKKIPNAILEPLKYALDKGKPFEMMSLAIAGWMAYAMESAAGRKPPLDDPMRSELESRAAAALDDPALFLSEPEIFPREIEQSDLMRRSLRKHARGLSGDIRGYLRRFVEE